MKIEQVREVASKALEHLSESLNQGQSEVLRNYLAAMGKFHRYSMSNVLSIITQRPDATRVAGYQTWRKLHRQVIRGANGIVIFAPLARRTVDANECGIETQPENLVGSRAAVVFGVADTAGNPLPSLSQFGRRLSSQSVPRFRPLVKKIQGFLKAIVMDSPLAPKRLSTYCDERPDPSLGLQAQGSPHRLGKPIGGLRLGLRLPHAASREGVQVRLV